MLESKMLAWPEATYPDLHNTKFIAWKCAIRLLQDDDDDIRTETSIMLSPIIYQFKIKEPSDGLSLHAKLHVDHVLEYSYKLLTQNYVEQDQTLASDYLLFLWEHIKIPENDKQQLAMRLPFDSNTGTLLRVELFDKENDNFYREDVFDIQLTHAQLLKSLSYLNEHHKQRQQELVAEWCERLFKQSDQMMAIFERAQQMNRQWYWTGGLSNHADVFICLYRLLLNTLVMKHFSADTRLDDFVSRLIKLHQLDQGVVEMNSLIEKLVHWFSRSSKNETFTQPSSQILNDILFLLVDFAVE